MVKGARRLVARAGDAVGSQAERFGRVWARLAGPVGDRAQAGAYTRTGLFVGAGVALAAVVLFIGRAERQRRAGKPVDGVEDGDSQG